MPDRRNFLRRLLSWPLAGCVVSKIPGRQAIARPPAPSEIIFAYEPPQEGDHPAYGGSAKLEFLSDAGKAAWDRGEDLDFNKGHFLTRDDIARLMRAELKVKMG